MGIFTKKQSKTQNVRIELDSKFFARLVDVLESHPGEQIDTTGIAYSGREDKQFIDIVGESNYQEDLKQYFKPEKWVYGFLAPEQSNEFDPNAVALYLVNDEKNEKGKLEKGAVKVGYLRKEMALKVSKKIASLLLNEGEVIPILAIIKNGDGKDANWAVWAYAMTTVIKF